MAFVAGKIGKSETSMVDFPALHCEVYMKMYLRMHMYKYMKLHMYM